MRRVAGDGDRLDLRAAGAVFGLQIAHRSDRGVCGGAARIALQHRGRDEKLLAEAAGQLGLVPFRAEELEEPELAFEHSARPLETVGRQARGEDTRLRGAPDVQPLDHAPIAAGEFEKSAAMTNALGLAGSLCSGILGCARGDGGMVKRLHVGRSSEAGVLAASLAADGFERPRTVLEGEFGFLKLFCTKWDEAELTRGLGQEVLVSTTGLKRYPCRATAHAAVRAVRDLQAEHGSSGPEVEAITVTGTRRM